jgi:aldehyde:ferredoxin oxidoreductase
MKEFGYAGTILKHDLSRNDTTKLSSFDYTDMFLGGRGIAAKLYWELVPPQTKAYDPDNCLVFMTGPLTGFTRLASCRWEVCGKSPMMEPEAFSYANLGGRWGSWLKFAGYDGLVIKGKADKPVYLFIHDGIIETLNADHLWGKTTFETHDALKAVHGKEVKVLAIGPAGENLVSFATMLTDDGGSGSGGLASVMGSKKLKAIVVTGNTRPQAADPEKLRNLADLIFQLKGKTFEHLPMPLIVSGRTKFESCYGCISGCFRQAYTENGRHYRFFCQASEFYRRRAAKVYEDWSEAALLASRLCDGYGLCTAVMEPTIEWLRQCYQKGILNDENTGLPLSRIGTIEFIEQLTRKIALREGFGDILAGGTLKAAESVGKNSQKLVSFLLQSRSNEFREYDPRLILTNSLLLATEPRQAIHQVHEAGVVLGEWKFWKKGIPGTYMSPEIIRNIATTFWGSSSAADYSTYEGKPLAAKKTQDRAYIKESLVLCDALWQVWCKHSESHVSDPTLESQLLAAVTGRKLEVDELHKIGERIFNLNRAILMRQGWGGRKGDKLVDFLHEEPLEFIRSNRDCIVPGKDGNVTSMKGRVVAREEFEKMKSEYYRFRGWDAESGFQTKAKLEDLQLGDVAEDLEKRGLLR